jgi:hypothetical protein
MVQSLEDMKCNQMFFPSEDECCMTTVDYVETCTFLCGGETAIFLY